MNRDYIEKLYGKRFFQITNEDMSLPKLPILWKGLASDDRNVRMNNFNILSPHFFKHMPKTQSFLEKSTTDVYIIFVEKLGYILVIDRILNERVFSYRSFEPHGAGKFGGSVGDFYSQLNGFSDFMSMGGLMPHSEILPLGEDDYEYWTSPSSKIAEKNKNLSYELIFNSGGKGKGYVNIDSTFADSPLALILWLDDGEPLEEMDFWDIYDNWTFIGMQAT